MINDFDYYYRLIAIPTWKCGYSCDYCDYRWANNGQELTCFGQTRVFGQEMTYQEWIDGLKKITQNKMSIIDFTGGEPLIYADIIDLINGLPDNILWAMTTSLQNDRYEKFNYINCKHVTCSYHYHVDKERFRDRLLYFNGRCEISVTIVVTPWHIENFKEAFKFFTSHGINVNVAIYLTKDFTWNQYPDYKKQVEDFLLMHNINDEATKLFEWKAPYVAERCEAGKDYFLIHPDGSIDRCYSYFIKNKSHIVNIKSDPMIMPYHELCDADCIVPCDQLRVKKEIL